MNNKEGPWVVLEKNDMSDIIGRINSLIEYTVKTGTGQDLCNKWNSEEAED